MGDADRGEVDHDAAGFAPQRWQKMQLMGNAVIGPGSDSEHAFLPGAAQGSRVRKRRTLPARPYRFSILARGGKHP